MPDPVLILGASGGIGAALARRLAARGQALVLLARDSGRLAALGAELDAPWQAADATDPMALAAAVRAAGPRLAGLAYCIGSIPLKPLAQLGPADFAAAFALNATGAALAVQAAQPALAAGGGAVLLVSSVAARAGFANHSAIGAAKAAVEGLTLALAAELAPAIRVNCVAPSLTRTPLAEPLTRNPAMAAAIARAHPIPRLGEAEDVAAVADFLLGPASGWVTGQIWAVDGGRSTLRGKG